MVTQKVIKEGKAEILFPSNNEVFYSPVQQFNRDMSIAVIREFAKLIEKENGSKKKLKILEALSASGLRSIRYAKELDDDIVDYVVANDLSKEAVESIERNVKFNGLSTEKVRPNIGDACDVLYGARKSKEFDVIDLDPYGSATMFIDGVVQAVSDGGLLCITCTDMAVLAGQNYDNCYAKYGSIPVKGEHCHELALRMLLNSLQSSASRYKRYIVPLLSLSVDYYVRVFVRVFTSAKKVKEVFSRFGMIYQCIDCRSFTTSAMGKMIKVANGFKRHLGRLPAIGDKCEICDCQSFHVGGPVYLDPIHEKSFIFSLLAQLKDCSEELYGTHSRMLGMVTMISEELEVPLFYTVSGLSGIVHCSCPPLIAVNSALLNAGYQVSVSHCKSGSLKTNAPNDFVWDILRAWIEKTSVKLDKYPAESPIRRILAKSPKHSINFCTHPKSNPPSRKIKLKRFEHHKGQNWGPRSKAKKRKQELDEE